MTRQEFPNLWTLLGAYLHQDWRLEYRTVDDAIQSFVAEASADELMGTRNEVQAVLMLPMDDAQLATLLTTQLGSSYDPRVDGMSPRAWLHKVARMLD